MLLVPCYQGSCYYALACPYAEYTGASLQIWVLLQVILQRSGGWGVSNTLPWKSDCSRILHRLVFGKFGGNQIEEDKINT